MTTLSLVRPQNDTTIVSLSRVLMYVSLIAVVFYFCVGPSGFLNAEKLIKALSVISFGFLIVASYLLWPTLNKNIKVFNLLYLIDVAIIAAVIFLLSGAGSKLSFMFLVPLMMSGLILNRKETLRLALFASILYSVVQLIQSNVTIDAINFTLNQFSFLIVLGFTAAFKAKSEDLEESLQLADLEIGTLKNLNELIVGNISFGIITTSLHGKILYQNVIAESILGESDLIGKPIRFVNVRLGEPIERARLSRKVIGELILQQSNGDKKTVSYSITPMIEKRAGHRGYLFVLEDVTAIKTLEFQLRQKEKLAAVGQLAAGIAHEIRNPLASISGSVQMITADAKNEEEKKLGKIIIKEIDRLNNLIAEFLDFARPPQVGIDELDINTLITEITELLRLNKHVNQDVESKLNLKSLNRVIGDKNKFKQALLNIIMNAYQSMNKTQSKKLTVNSYDDADKVVVEVIDTGCGIPENELTKIFEAFHTTKVGGTGLGLAITHKILEAHKVEIQVSSEVNVGTKFRLLFPAVPLDLNDKNMRGIA